VFSPLELAVQTATFHLKTSKQLPNQLSPRPRTFVASHCSSIGCLAWIRTITKKLFHLLGTKRRLADRPLGLQWRPGVRQSRPPEGETCDNSLGVSTSFPFLAPGLFQRA
jgi:hypothetical protein